MVTIEDTGEEKELKLPETERSFEEEHRLYDCPECGKCDRNCENCENCGSVE